MDDNSIKAQRIRNPLYSDRQAAMDIFQWIQNYDFLIAFEPKSCDRYRLKSLLNSVDVSWYPLIEKKCLDLQRLCINHFCHSDHLDDSKVYLPGLGLDDVWTYLLPKSSLQPSYFVETNDSWPRLVNGINNKCKWDVHRLINIYLFLYHFYLQ